MMRAAMIAVLIAIAVALGQVRIPGPGGSAPAGGGPITISDNFDAYTNGSDLDAAADWVRRNGSANDILVAKPASDGVVYSNNQTSQSTFYYHNTTMSADQCADIQWTVIGGAELNYSGPAVRIQTGAVSAYSVSYIRSGEMMYLTWTVAGSSGDVASTAKTYSNGVRIRLCASGSGSSTRLTVYEDTVSDGDDDWVAVWSNLDPGASHYIDGGYPGLAFYGLDEPRFDNFHADEIP